MLYTVVVQWVEAAVAFYNTVGNGHAINSCNFYRIEGLTGRENIVKVLSALPLAAPSAPVSPPLHRKRSPSPRVHFVRPFLFKKEHCRPVTNLSFPRIRRPIILRPGNVDEPSFFFDKGKYDGGREKRSGRGNKCEIGGGSVGIEASK